MSHLLDGSCGQYLCHCPLIQKQDSVVLRDKQIHWLYYWTSRGILVYRLDYLWMCTRFWNQGSVVSGDDNVSLNCGWCPRGPQHLPTTWLYMGTQLQPHLRNCSLNWPTAFPQLEYLGWWTLLCPGWWLTSPLLETSQWPSRCDLTVDILCIVACTSFSGDYCILNVVWTSSSFWCSLVVCFRKICPFKFWFCENCTSHNLHVRLSIL